MRTPTVALAACLLLSGCLSLRHVRFPSGEEHAAQARCAEDNGAAWLAPRPRVTRLLMAETEDPRASSILVFKPPAPSVTPDVMAFMEGLGLSSVDVLLRPWPEGSAGFGADREGVYRISVADPGDPACAAYARYLATPRADGKPIFPYTSPDRCIAVTLVSDVPDMAAYSHVAVSYVDASTRGWFRYVEELRDRDSQVYARSVIYAFNAPLSPGCPGARPSQRLADIMRP